MGSTVASIESDMVGAAAHSALSELSDEDETDG